MIPLTSPIVMLMRIPFMYLCGNRHICNVIVRSFFVSFGLLQSKKMELDTEMARSLRGEITVG
jgi:hypothetical protein